MVLQNTALPIIAVRSLRTAAADRSPVKGLTHDFYRYPARFSPTFVASAIEHFTRPGQLVLDPYMGGGTTIVEALARRRVAIGCDLNALAVFVTQAKVSQLSDQEKKSLSRWATGTVQKLSYHTNAANLSELICPERTRNLDLPRSRPAKKFFALAMQSTRRLHSVSAQNFAKAVLLNVAQWALHNRKVTPTLNQIRQRILSSCKEMIVCSDELSNRSDAIEGNHQEPILIHDTATNLLNHRPFHHGTKVDLVVTSPPYPGIHMLYHRWQVDGRKETPAPYWIADCLDGEGSTFYNFAGRKPNSQDDYFEESLRTLRAIRAVMRPGAYMVQMIAFSRPRTQLPRYLESMAHAGFEEILETLNGDSLQSFRRIWRAVPNRAWYANLKGKTASSREVVLIHRAA